MVPLFQDTDPSKRPGAGPDGYAPLKKHSFFKGIDWKNLWKTPPPPRLAPVQDVTTYSTVCYFSMNTLASCQRSHTQLFPFRLVWTTILKIIHGILLMLEVIPLITIITYQMQILVVHHLLKRCLIFLH